MTTENRTDGSPAITCGFLQPLGNGVLDKLKGRNNKFWFALQDAGIKYYDQPSSQPPHDNQITRKERGDIDLSTSFMDVLVMITGANGKEYLLSPPQDATLVDWLTQLKNATDCSSTEVSSPVGFERSGGKSLMSKVRNSLRRRRRSANPRMSPISGEELKSTGPLSPIGPMSPSEHGSHTSPTGETLHTKAQKDRPRSRTFPSVQPLDGTSLGLVHDLDSCGSPMPEVGQEPCEESAKSFEDRTCDTTLDRPFLQFPDTRRLEFPDEQDGKAFNRSVSRLSQTDERPNDQESMIQQLQRIIRDLEIDICKLKCEVIGLIQGTLRVPLKAYTSRLVYVCAAKARDDDLADWHFVEDVRYKERVYALLREARYANAQLPNIDSSVASNFKDGYGFLHGSRESESEFFHYVCRELTQHYYKFYKDKTGQVQLWRDFIDSKESRKEDVLFKERELDCLARDGIPTDLRAAVWKSLILEKVAHIRHEKGGDYFNKLCQQVEKRKSVQAGQMDETERQIKCDLLRTMPNNERFKSLDSEGISKLSTILHAFCLHRPDISYLQGMNFIVALCLLFLDEEDAFWSLVAVTEIYLKNYFDDLLSGAQADLLVLNDLVGEKLPALQAHFKYYAVDISTVTFNWLITVFVDAVPFETTLRIWDSFLFEGREALFRIALGMLKLQQRSLLQLSGALEIMQYMKRCARVTYEADKLLKVSFDDCMDPFPDNKALEEMQKKYVAGIKAKQDLRITLKEERKRSRVSSFSVNIRSLDRPEKTDQCQLVECALATSKDLSSPVCLFCGSRGTAQLYLLDIKKKEMCTMNVQIKSRVLCAELVGESIVLVGTVDWFVHAFHVDLREEVWCIQLSDSVIDLCQNQNGTVFAAMADGSITVLQNATHGEPPSAGIHTRIGRAPVTCVTMVKETVWCGCGNNVVILTESVHGRQGSLDELDSIVVSSSPRHQVANLLHGEHGVWCTIRGSSYVILLDDTTFEVLLKMDVRNLQCSLYPGEPGFCSTPIPRSPGGDTASVVSHFQESRVTTIMPVDQELWVGLGNGQVLIFDVIDGSHDDQEAAEVGQNEVSAGIDGESQPEGSRRVVSPEDTTSPSTGLTGKAGMNRRPPERLASINDAYQDYKFRLEIRVLYRISEEAIRCLLLLRETDPMVLSCAGTLSGEGALSLWERQTEPHTDEWLPRPIRHCLTEKLSVPDVR